MARAFIPSRIFFFGIVKNTKRIGTVFVCVCESGRLILPRRYEHFLSVEDIRAGMVEMQRKQIKYFAKRRNGKKNAELETMTDLKENLKGRCEDICS